ncbi:Uncharacterized protein APZ42_012552 [Daphnia magna]|uniref:Uncharacterized protein n=1 Tax=Daphnia magna TaxID=35525 RepID=A0A162RPU3_9CRUS|nr:Uncharacterized protein APZ42_012552 [Daphnia magna]
MKNDTDFQEQTDNWLKELNGIALKKKGQLMSFWGKQACKEKDNSQLEFSVNSKQFCEPESDGEQELMLKIVGTSTGNENNKSTTTRVATVQNELESKRKILNSDLVGLIERQKAGLISKSQEEESKNKKAQIAELKATLKRKKAEQERSKKHRAALEKHPDVRESLTVKAKPGRPRLEESEPELLKTIINMAIHGSVAHEEIQSEVYRSILTLNDLHDQLKKDGFHLSRRMFYLHLMPKRCSSLEATLNFLEIHTIFPPISVVGCWVDSFAVIAATPAPSLPFNFASSGILGREETQDIKSIKFLASSGILGREETQDIKSRLTFSDIPFLLIYTALQFSPSLRKEYAQLAICTLPL